MSTVDNDKRGRKLKPLLVALLLALIGGGAFLAYHEMGRPNRQAGVATFEDALKPAAPKASRPIVEEPAGRLEADRSGTGPQVAAGEGAAQDSAKTPDTSVPRFDIVRVEPDGGTLIAGQATPNARISIENNGIVIAETTADATGAFVALPEQKLSGESNEVTIRSTDENGKQSVSEQVVAIGLAGKGEPLVALLEPGKAVSLLQKPADKSGEQELAQAILPNEPIVGHKDQPPASAPIDHAATKPQEPFVQTDGQVVVDALKDVTERQGEAQNVLANADTAPADEGDGASTSLVPAPEPASTVNSDDKENKNKTEETRRIARLLPDQERVAGKEEVAGVTGNGPALLSPPAVEGAVSGLSASVSSSASPVAQSVKPDETAEAPANGLAADGSLAVAGDKAPEIPQSSGSSGSSGVFVVVEAVELDRDKFFVAGKSVPEAVIRLYIDGQNVGQTKADEKGHWLFEQRLALKPDSYTIRADQVEASNGNVIARAQVPFVVEDKTLSELAENKTGHIIIRRHDNLWTIARRLYGNGQRYTAIYQANRDQIRDPDLIYPGQIFTLPDTAQ